MEGRRKVYAAVNADFNTEGRCRPRSITFEDGRLYEIDRVLQASPFFSVPFVSNSPLVALLIYK